MEGSLRRIRTRKRVVIVSQALGTTPAHKVHIVGIGEDGEEGLTGPVRQLVAAAEILIGTAQTLSRATRGNRECLIVADDYEVAVDRIARETGKKIVVLTGGDPLFYGIARYLCDRLGKDRFVVAPHVSSMQLAFARVKENWDDAYLVNLATLHVDRVVERARSAEKVGLFTTELRTPAVVARALLDRKIDYFVAYVCENLGSPDERVTRGELTDIAGSTFAPLNVMILVRKPSIPDRPLDMAGHRLFGNPDECFLQSQPKRGLLTSMEIRAIALAEMDLGPRSVIWDVGAGSGSVAVEAAQIAHQGQVFAIEVDPEDILLIQSNAQRFGVKNLTTIAGQAPDAWIGLPTPDAIFVGGTGRMVSRISQQAFEHLRERGRLVINVGSIENLASVRQILHQLGAEVTIRMVNLALSTEQLDSVRFEARHPTFLVSAIKPVAH